MKTTNANAGMRKIDRATTSCFSPPAPTPKHRKAQNI